MLLLALIVAAGAGAAPQSTNPEIWERASDYVRLEGAVITSNVRIELTVDENGDPVHCTILQSDEAKGFDNRFCTVPMRRAHFRPARDEDGRPIAGVFSTNFHPRSSAHGYGAEWNDYTLTVRGLPAGRPRTVTARVVTDAAGHVESCAVEKPSGVVQLDEATCRFTRSSLSLAAPFDRDGRLVRAMRLVSVGFNAASTADIVTK